MDAPTTTEARDLRRRLLAWYRASRRDLPWRRTRDAYRIWVSEVMLQQTRVAAVIPYYERFLERFPDVHALAAVGEDQVLAAWSGLGYYRRARSLHRGARVVVERHGGRLPRDAAALRSLPGVGSYTAGAIASIAFDLAEPAVDANVRRVLSRLFAVKARNAENDRTLDGLARGLVARGDARDLNQALMELGALVCAPETPRCDECPVRPHCRAHASGRPAEYPRPQRRSRPTEVAVAVAWIARGTSFVVERPTSGGPLRGTWDVPAVEFEPETRSARALETSVAARHGIEIQAAPAATRLVHAIMDRRLRISVHPCRLVRGRVARRPDVSWRDVSSLDDLATSGVTKKVARAMSRVVPEAQPAPGPSRGTRDPRTRRRDSPRDR